MNFRIFFYKHLLILSALLISVTTVFAMDDPDFFINRMVIAEKISGREPVNITETIPAETETIFCFLEATDIGTNTEVSFVWFQDGQERARVVLPLEKGARWRTFSSKKINAMNGKWTVELHDASGVVLNTVSFSVQ